MDPVINNECEKIDKAQHTWHFNMPSDNKPPKKPLAYKRFGHNINLSILTSYSKLYSNLCQNLYHTHTTSRITC